MKKPPTTWAGLNRHRSLRPIKSESDFRLANGIVDRLCVLSKMTRDQHDYLDSLTALMDSFSALHHRIDTSDLSPIDVLEFLLRQHRMTRSDLGRLLGDRSLGSRIMSGRRELNKRHVGILRDRFGVSADLFVPRAEAA